MSDYRFGDCWKCFTFVDARAEEASARPTPGGMIAAIRCPTCGATINLAPNARKQNAARAL